MILNRINSLSYNTPAGIERIAYPPWYTDSTLVQLRRHYQAIQTGDVEDKYGWIQHVAI